MLAYLRRRIGFMSIHVMGCYEWSHPLLTLTDIQPKWERINLVSFNVVDAEYNLDPKQRP